MVSTTYILDHLFKYHNNGFSWRNLELTPEIIDINKAPILRSLIDDIVHFLLNNHLDSIQSGLYDFRFNKRIANELQYLSVINEKESATFNFTLDESQEIKRHYNKRLRQLLNQNQSQGSTERNKQLVFQHSVSFIQGNLADLYFYDQEYDDAIITYKEAIQTLRNNAQMKPDVLVIYTRLILKLSLTFEKKKSYTSALMVLDEVSNRILLELNHPLEETSSYEYHRKCQLISSVRLLLQPFISKLHCKIKEKPAGPADSNLKLFMDELSLVLKIIPPEDSVLIKAEYWNKLGDLMFFTKPNVTEESRSALEYYQLSLVEVLKSDGDKTSTINCTNILKHILLYLSQKSVVNILNDSSSLGTPTKPRNLMISQNEIMANSLSDLADCYASQYERIDYSSRESRQTLNHLLLTLEKITLSTERLSHIEKISGESKIARTFVYYILASRVYETLGDFRNAAYQLTKIMYILEDSISTAGGQDKSPLATILLRSIDRVLVKKHLELTYLNYDGSSRPETELFKNLLTTDSKTVGSSKYILSQLPAYTEIQEILILYRLLQLKLPTARIESGHDDLLMSNGSGSIYQRIQSLHFKCRRNYSRLLEITSTRSETLVSAFIESKKSGDLREVSILVTDSIICLTEILKIYRTLGPSRLTPYTELGFTYFLRAWWLEVRTRLEVKGGNKDILTKDVRNIVGSQAMNKLTVQYNVDRARTYFRRAIDTFDSRTERRNLDKDMFYLNDDYNDAYYHFHTALEERRISSGRVLKKINFLKDCADGKRSVFPNDCSLNDQHTSVSLITVDSYF